MCKAQSSGFGLASEPLCSPVQHTPVLSTHSSSRGIKAPAKTGREIQARSTAVISTTGVQAVRADSTFTQLCQPLAIKACECALKTQSACG